MSAYPVFQFMSAAVRDFQAVAVSALTIGPTKGLREEGFEITKMSPPFSGDQDKRRGCQDVYNHAAIPFITPEQANTINPLIKSLIEKDDTSEKTASAIIKILQMER